MTSRKTAAGARAALAAAALLVASSAGAAWQTVTAAPVTPAAAVTPLTHRAACHVRVSVNLTGAPAGFLADVHRVLDEYATVTGVTFTVDTSLRTVPDRAVPAGPDDVTPLGVAWADPGRNAAFDGMYSTYGLALLSMRGDRIVSATVLLNQAGLRPRTWTHDGTTYRVGTAVVPGFSTGGRGPVGVTNLLRHEIGHVLGLEHAPAPLLTSTMLTGPVRFRGEDRLSDDVVGPLTDGYAACR